MFFYILILLTPFNIELTFFFLLRLPMINTLVTIKIHRYSLYNPRSLCAFIDNNSISNECVNEYACQNVVYYKNAKICSILAEFCERDSIQSSGIVRASVISYRKNHAEYVWY